MNIFSRENQDEGCVDFIEMAGKISSASAEIPRRADSSHGGEGKDCAPAIGGEESGRKPPEQAVGKKKRANKVAIFVLVLFGLNLLYALLSFLLEFLGIIL